MHKDESWISGRLQQCLKAHTPVTEAAATRLKGLLEGETYGRLLTQRELLVTAAQLMDDMVEPDAPMVGGGNAN